MIRLLKAAIGTAVVAGALVLAPGSAVASGGGCTVSTQNGWDAAVCSSDNGVTVFGDMYINQQGNLGNNCLAKYGLWDLNLGKYVKFAPNQPCYVGHHPNIDTPKVAGHKYQTIGIIQVNGSTVWSAGGPYTW